jgi:hypothetical protein
VDRQPSHRRVGLVVLLLGAAIIFVNAYMEEANGWSFFPLGAIGAALLGVGLWYSGLLPSRR